MTTHFSIPRVAILFVLACVAAPLPAQTLLTPQGRRISREAIARDLDVISGWRKRVDSLPREAAPPLRFQRTKAEQWMRFVESEYEDNERGPVLEAALWRVITLATATERGSELSGYEPDLPGTKPVRPDLHERVRVHVRRGAMACAPEVLGEMEVQLTAAAHAPGSVGRSNATTAIRRVEALDTQLGDAPCTPAVVATTEPIRAPEPVAVTPTDAAPVAVAPTDSVPAATTVRANAPGRVQFGFGRSSLSPRAQARLRRLTTALRDVSITSIEIAGHADRHGRPAVNLRISRARAAAVRRYLVRSGIMPNVISLRSYGSSQLRDRRRTKAADARNRRVEIRITTASGAVITIDDKGDLVFP